LYLPLASSLLECVFFFLFTLRQTAEPVWDERKNKKDIFLMQFRSFESGPDLSLPPCTLVMSSVLKVKRKKASVIAAI
jgi:hypothetical protein